VAILGVIKGQIYVAWSRLRGIPSIVLSWHLEEVVQALWIVSSVCSGNPILKLVKTLNVSENDVVNFSTSY